MDKRTDIKILGVLFLFVFLLEFWVSINSYTHDLYNRIDSGWSFMCGKAWMNGMIPYVDFAESRGPLLWLIFGIGYLFSNYNYLGLFWLECIFYTGTFFYCYRIGCLFLSDKKNALLCSMLLALAFFCGAYHYETRSDDFCQLFIIGTLYYTFRAIYKLRNDKDILVASFATGVSFAATLLIKYNIAAMILIFFFALFYFLFRCRKDLILKSFLYAFSGICLVLFPFLAYFLYQGNFNDFINEYFIATSQIVVKDSTLVGMIKDYLFEGWGSIFHIHPVRSIVVCFLLANIIGGCIFFYRKLTIFKCFPAIIAFWFISISMYHAYIGHYYQNFSGFAIFPIIMYLTFFKRLKWTKFRLAFLAISIILIVFVGNLTFMRPNFFLNKTKERDDFYYVNYIMSQVQNPKIMFSCYDIGYGTPVHALPSCRYWTEQWGATEKILSARKLVVEQQLSDFVFVMTEFDNGNFMDLLQQSNYVKYYTWTTQEASKRYETHLFGKPGLTLSPNNFNVSAMDILLKRRILKSKSEN